MNILTFLLAGFLSMQAGTASEWKDKGPTDTGWRSARPGMTLDEVLAAFPGQAKREKDEKADSGAKLPVVKFKEKVRIDGAEYEVSFHFSSEGKLVSIQFYSRRIKEEIPPVVFAIFRELYGAPTDFGTKSEMLPRQGREISEYFFWKTDAFEMYASSYVYPYTPFMKATSLSVRVFYIKK